METLDDIEMQQYNSSAYKRKGLVAVTRDELSKLNYVLNDRPPIAKSLKYSGIAYLLLSCANCAVGLYLFFYVNEHHDQLVFLASVKYLTSIIAAFFMTVAPLYIFGCTDLAIGLFVPVIIGLCTVQQIVSSYYGSLYWVENAAQDVWYDNLKTDFWTGEAVLGLWTLMNCVGVLICSSDRGKHLREIEGDFDKQAIEMRVQAHKDLLKASKERAQAQV